MVPAVTWIGHASMLMQTGGINILTDPMFSERASPFVVRRPEARTCRRGSPLAELPHIDAVVISHNHYDHLDEASVKTLAAQPGGPPLFVVPLGVKAWFADVGIDNAVELDWWQSARVGAVEIVLVPAQHWSGRSLTDRMETLWGGYAIFAPDFQVFFAGDTGYSKDFADIRARFAARHGAGARLRPGADPDRRLRAALVHEASSTSIRREAVQIHLDLAAERSIGIHWGTFAAHRRGARRAAAGARRARRQRRLADERSRVMAIGADPPLPAARALSAAGAGPQTTATSSRIAASSVAPGASATRPCAAGSAMWIALLTWLTGSTQK